MIRVEKHHIKPDCPFFAEADDLCFRSKNLYNLALYEQRQRFFEVGTVFSYEQLDVRLKTSDAYRGLPAKVSQQVLKQVCQDWTSYFAAAAEYARDRDKFLAEPKIPKYKPKATGRNVVVYTIQAVSRKALKRGVIHPSQTTLSVPTRIPRTHIQQVRLVPKLNSYVLEVVYELPDVKENTSSNRIVGIDLGIENLATIASNCPELKPVLVNGRPVKGLNARYNQHKARLQSQLPKDQATSTQIKILTARRNRRIENALHQSSRMIVNLCLQYRIDTVVIGKNDLWKQNVTLGSVVNQQFTAIPHARLIELLTYKCQSVGIKVVTIEESYTSKCSFLDGEAVEKQARYAGKRIHRGLFRTGRGLLLNADVNAALNLINKAVPDAFGPGPEAGGHGMADWVVNPVRVTPFGKAVSGTSKREATCEHQLYGSVSQARPPVPILGLGTRVCQI